MLSKSEFSVFSYFVARVNSFSAFRYCDSATFSGLIDSNSVFSNSGSAFSYCDDEVNYSFAIVTTCLAEYTRIVLIPPVEDVTNTVVTGSNSSRDFD